MSQKGTVVPARRTGAETRALVQSTALRLFTEQGYEATSLRQIADEVGINKASLYYYFDGKQAILDAVVQQRGDEAEELLRWLAEQPRTPGLVEAAVMRWVDTYSTEKLHGIRLMTANPHLGDKLAGAASGERIGFGLITLADELAHLLPDPSPQNAVLLRMALLSINAAVQASAQSSYPDQEIVTAAKRAAQALLTSLRTSRIAR